MTDSDLERIKQREKLENSLIEGNKKEGKGSLSLSPVKYVGLIILLLAAAVILVYFGSKSIKTSGSSSWQKDLSELSDSVDTFVEYKGFKTGIIRYTKDGAIYYNEKGESVWEKSYEMTGPIVDVSHEYAAVADEGGHSIYIFDADSALSHIETSMSIVNVRVADNGIVYVTLNDNEASYITAYKPTGESIDLQVKSILTGDGFPIDIDVSPDGTQLIGAYINIKSGRLQNSVVFRNFGSVGQNENARRVVGGFSDTIEGAMPARVHFATDEESVVFYDKGLAFFSTKVLNTPKVVKTVEIADEIESIAYSDKTLSLIKKNADDGSYELMIYDYAGKELGEAPLDKPYKGISMNDSLIVLYNDNELKVYGTKGKLKYETNYEDDNIKSIEMVKNGKLYIALSTSLNLITI